MKKKLPARTPEHKSAMSDEEIFDQIPPEALTEEVRRKALEFTKTYLQQGMEFPHALRLGIEKAEAWFLEMQG